MKKPVSKLISLIVCVAMILTFDCTGITNALAASSDISQQADVNSEGLSSEDAATATDDSVTSDYENIAGSEIVEARGANAKCYKLDNGQNEVIMYGQPVHYLKDGKYVPIDNSLTLTTNSAGEKIYKNTANSFDVEISEQNNYIKISMGSYSLSWSIDKFSTNVEGVYSNGLTTDQWHELSSGDQRHNIPNLATDISYKNVLSNIDLQYLLVSNTVKESIIFNSSPDIFTITERIDVNGLKLVQNEDGSIDAVDKDTGKGVFNIPAAYLIDDEGNECYDVKVNITSKDNEYTIAYTLNEEWMSSAKYPIIFDPTVTIDDGNDGSLVYDNRIAQGLPTTNYATSSAMSTGYESSSQNNYCLIKYTNFVSYLNSLGVTSYNQILSANMTATLINGGSYSSVVQIYAIDKDDSWNESVVWNTKPGIESNVYPVSQIIGIYPYVDYTWTITDIAQYWLGRTFYGETGTNNGLLMKDTSTTSYYKEWATWQSAYYDGVRLSVIYDATAPTAPTSISTSPSASSSWTNYTSYPALYWSGITDSGGSGLSYVQYNIDNGTWAYAGIGSSGSTLVSVGNPGTHTIYVRGVDGSGNLGVAGSVTYNLDTTAPTAPTSVTTTPAATSSYTNNLTPTLSWSGITDTFSGVNFVQYMVDIGSWITIPTSNGKASGSVGISLTTAGTHTIYVRGVDCAGNFGSSASVTYKVDLGGPLPPASVTTNPDASSISTNNASPVLSWSGITDMLSSISNAEYKVDDGSWMSIDPSYGTASGSLSISLYTSGTHTIYVRGADSAGNKGSAASVTYKLDSIAYDTRVGMKSYESPVSFDTQSGTGYINADSGNLLYETTDLGVSSPFGALAFTRSYNSQTAYETPLGVGWDYGYNITLVKQYDSNNAETGVVLKMGNGSMYFFTKNTDGTYTSPSGVYANLTKSATTGKYTLTYENGTVFAFNTYHQIERITNRQGNYLQFTYNSAGKVTAIADNAGNTITITYSTVTGENGLIKTVNGSGKTVNYVYSSRKLVQAYVTCNSQQVGEQYSYTDGVITTITNPNGNGYGIVFTSDKVTSVTNPLNQEKTISYSTDNGYILVTTVFNHVTQRYWYDSNSLVLAKHQFESEDPTVMTYDSNYNVTHIDYPDGTDESYTYSSIGNVLTYVNKAGKTTTYTYGDTNNPTLPTQVTEPFNGSNTKVTNYAYNSNGNVTSTSVTGINQTTAYTYTTYGNVDTQTVTITDGTNTYTSVTDYDYDTLGRLIKTTLPDSTYTEQSYDTYGNVEYTTDAKGIETRYYYNVLGQLTQQTSAYGTTDAVSTYSTYDAMGNILTQTDAKGNVTEYTYDALGRQTRVDYADNTYETITYTVNSDGTQVTADYDANGNKTVTVTNKKGQTTLTGTVGDATNSNNTATYTYGGETLIEYTRSAYDVMGNVTWSTDSTGVETNNTYNDMGWVTEATTSNGSLSTTTSYTYDDAGNALTEVTPDATTTTTYDKLDRSLTVTTSKNGSSAVTEYEYNGVYNGKLQTVMTDPLSRETTFEYDTSGNLVRELYEGRTTVYTYDDNGNMLTSTLTDSNYSGQSAVTSYTYDNLNRKTSITYSANDEYVIYTYDDNGNVLTEALYENGSLSSTTTYTYDSQNRVLTVSRDSSTIVEYTYTANGNVASVEYGSNGQIISYEHDEAGKVVRVKDITDSQNPVLIREYFYVNGLLSYLVDERGTDDAKQEFTYDSLGRLSTVKYYGIDDMTVLEEYTITYNDTSTDAKNQIETETTTTRYAGNVIVTEKDYTYDNLGRLTQESDTVTVNGGTPTTATTSYTYDAVGNRLSMMSGSTTLYYHYNDYDQLLSTDYDNDTSTTSDIVTSYTYDLSGNQITETEGTSTTTYHYDDANWLQYVTDSGNNTLANYDYDANGQRIQKTVGTAETNYFYTGIQLLYTTDSSNATIEQNILETDGSMICSKRANGNYYWYRQDIRGSVTNIVDVDDDVVKSYTYDAYGNTSSTGTFVNSFAYTGAVIDTETGLYYMNARYYEPETGRFISQDTYRGDGEAFWHLYAYCNGDPVNETDPSGHKTNINSGYKCKTFMIGRYDGKVKIEMYWEYYCDYKGDEFSRLKKGYATLYYGATGASFRNLRIGCHVDGGWVDPNGDRGIYWGDAKWAQTKDPKNGVRYMNPSFFDHYLVTGWENGVIAVSVTVEYKWHKTWYKAEIKGVSEGSRPGFEIREA